MATVECIVNKTFSELNSVEIKAELKKRGLETKGSLNVQKERLKKVIFLSFFSIKCQTSAELFIYNFLK